MASESIAAQTGFTKFARKFGLFQGLLPINKKRIPTEIIAGTTLAALAIPEVMGYTKIAGMPVITGLYTILLPILIFAILGSSKHLVVGADSATAAILFAGLISIATPYSAEWVNLAGWLAIIAAGMLVLAKFLKLGFIANFLSHTVLIGFLTGVGIQVACGQVAGMFGLSKEGRGPLSEAFNAITSLSDASKATIAVSLGVLATIIVARKVNKKIPGALIAVIGAIALSYWLNFSVHGVSVLGTVPSGLPALTWPSLPSSNEWALLFTTATSIFLVILAQSAATSRAYAVKYNELDFNEDKDLVGIGGANIAAAATGTFVVNGSPTKTQMVDSAGGRSQIAQLTTAALVVIVLLFLTKPLAYMPNAVLAAVVFLIGVELIDIKGMKRVFQTRRDEFWVALITAAVVVVVGVEQGIILAIVLSIIIHLRKSYKPNNMLITFENEQMNTNPVRSHAQLLPGLVVYHFGSSLYYANAESFQEEVLKLAEDGDPKVRWFVLEASAIGDIDYTGAETLKTVISLLNEHKVRFVVTHLSKHPLEELLASDVVEVIGRENIYVGLKDVTKEYRTKYKVKLLK